MEVSRTVVGEPSFRKLQSMHAPSDECLVSFLGYVDLLGVTYEAKTLATGYGAYIAQPLLRDAVEEREGQENSVTEEEARKILESSMRVLFYRDARSLNKYQVATITATGISISESQSLSTEWSFAEGIRGYGAQTQ